MIVIKYNSCVGRLEKQEMLVTQEQTQSDC